MIPKQEESQMDTLNTPALDKLHADWAARGWDTTNLAAFRMEDEPDLDAVLDTALDGLADDDVDTPAETDPAAATTTEPAAATTDPAAEAKVFDEKYVQDLRNESARYRTERNQLRDEHGRYVAAFEGLDPELRDTFLQLPQAYRDNPVATAQWMREQAQAILEGQQTTPQGDPADKPLTRAEYNRIKAEERVAADAANILKQVTDLGYNPATYEGRAFMQFALDAHGGDITAAHTAAQAEKEADRKKAVEAFLEEKKKAADTPSPVVGGSRKPTEGAPAITSIKDAAKAVESHLDAIFAKS